MCGNLIFNDQFKKEDGKEDEQHNPESVRQSTEGYNEGSSTEARNIQGGNAQRGVGRNADRASGCTSSAGDGDGTGG